MAVLQGIWWEAEDFHCVNSLDSWVWKSRGDWAVAWWRDGDGTGCVWVHGNHDRRPQPWRTAGEWVVHHLHPFPALFLCYRLEGFPIAGLVSRSKLVWRLRQTLVGHTKSYFCDKNQEIHVNRCVWIGYYEILFPQNSVEDLYSPTSPALGYYLGRLNLRAPSPPL